MATIPQGTWWREQRAQDVDQTLRGAVRAGSRWVFVGEDAAAPLILTLEIANHQDVSPTFTPRAASGSDHLHGVANLAIGPVVVAVGDNGRIEESTDQGQTWSGQTLAGSPQLRDVVSSFLLSSSRFIAVGNDEIWGRDSVGTWTQRWSGSQLWQSVAYLPSSGFIAAGNGGFCSHSPTGASGTWTAPFAVAGDTITEVRANASVVLAAAEGSIYRSSTGLSGSWSLVSTVTPRVLTLFPLGPSGNWVAFNNALECYATADDGDTWTQVADVPVFIVGGYDEGTTAYAVGASGTALVSFDQTQADYVAPDAITQDSEAAFNANDDMSGDAVRRLVTQFRSGRG